MTTIPELYRLGALSFNIPELPLIVVYTIYTFAGLLITIGAFSVNRTP